jgi:hypothetical protein
MLIDLQRIKAFFFVKDQKYESGSRLKFKILFCLIETTHEPLRLDKWNLVPWKTMDVPASFVWIIIFLAKFLNVAMVWNFDLFRQSMNHSA